MAATMSTTEQVLKKIKTLPPMPLVVQKLIKVMDDENCSATDVSDVLSSDQALTGKVLKLVNSSFFGLSGTVSTISRAVVILGMGPLRNLALGMSLAKLMPKSGEEDLQESFWAHAMACAAASEVIAREINYPDPEEAFIAGLLHDMGQMVLKDALPNEFSEFLALNSTNILDDEKRLMGMAHTRTGQKLMKHWKLPSLLGQVARFHHTPAVFGGKDDPLVSVVALGDAMGQACVGALETPMADSDFLDLIDRTGLNMEKAREILEAVKARIEETKLFLQIALDGELESAPEVSSPQLTCVVIGSDPTKISWLQELLGYHGHHLISMKEFFGQEDSRRKTDLVLIDPDSIGPEQLTKMAPILSQVSNKIVRAGQERHAGLDGVAGREVECLPLVFSQDYLGT